MEHQWKKKEVRTISVPIAPSPAQPTVRLEAFWSIASSRNQNDEAWLHLFAHFS
jgi:hypothetical protein